MSLWKIAWRSIQQRSLASSLTALSMALGVALVVAVLVIHSVVSRSFQNDSGLGYNMIVGADKGGKLQLVLNTVYYLSSPVENIPYSFYKEFTEGEYKPYVNQAIPVCLGDYYERFRVVGTTPAFFDKLTYGGKAYQFSQGRNFQPEEFFSGVIGSKVAQETGLKAGDEFHPTHGAVPGSHQHDPFKIVGVLAPTGTPNDRALFINIEGFYLLDNHAKPVEAETKKKSPDPKSETEDKKPDAAKPSAEHEHEDHDEHNHDARDHEHGEHAEDRHDHDAHELADHDHGDHDHAHSHEPLPEAQREVTAILVLTAAPAGGLPELYVSELLKKVNKGLVGQAVLPIREIQNLFTLFVDPIQHLLLALTVLIVIIAGVGILVSIYNSMSDRRRDLAVMRSLGAGRQSVMLVVLLESVLLALGGGLLGCLLGHALIGFLSNWIALETGVSISALAFHPLELVIIPALVLLATVVGLLPALEAYRTDVAKTLSDSP